MSTPGYEEVMRLLNPEFLPTQEQREVIESASPAILVVAGAGSGKTATMANRIAYQIAIGTVAPSEVLGLTFTRKAAGELAERVDRALAKLRRAGIDQAGDLREELDRPTISTYNSFAAEISASYGMLIGADPAARLITDAERWQIMREIVSAWPYEGEQDDLNLASPAKIIDTALMMSAALIDNHRGTDDARAFFDKESTALEGLIASKRRFSKMPAESKQWSELEKKAGTSLRLRRRVLDIVDAYLVRKRELGVVEFADQVSIAAQVLREHPELGRELSDRYRLVLLDEYQDTSVNQADFLAQALAPASASAGTGTEVDGRAVFRSVCAVGDPYQAIYGWRGASANALADFEREFARRLGTIQKLSLTVSFRNDEAILAAANAVATGIQTEALPVKPLHPRPGSGQGRVVEVRPLLREDSYRAIAWRIRDVMERVAVDPERRGRGAEIAVLCRKHSYVELVTAALSELDIPYELVGGESLIRRPEILTIRAALAVLATPGRNDQLLRLLTLVGVSGSDLRALRAWSGEIAAREIGKTGGGDQTHERDGSPVLSVRDEQSLVEAATFLPEDDWKPRHGPALSHEGRRRLGTLTAALTSLRSTVHAPLSDVIAQTSRLLGLDLAAASRAEGAQRVRTSLDSFVALGDSYQKEHPGASLVDFLEWLDASDAREHGGEEESGVDDVRVDEAIEVSPGIVQIMTVHAAKGLEWRDLVVVPEVVDGQFSDVVAGVKAWPQNNEVFPFPLRADNRHLPQFEISQCEDNIDAGISYLRFKSELLPEYESQEARRLAYVAFTRPRAELLVAGYGLRDKEQAVKFKSAEAGGSEAALVARSTYATDMRKYAKVVPVADVAGENWPRELIEEVGDTIARDALVAQLGEEAVQQEGPSDVPHYADMSELRRWPQDVPRSLGRLTPVASDTDPAEWEWQAELLLAERRSGKEEEMRKAERPYLTATDVVHLSQDAEAFLLNQRRPVPQKPSRAARLGTTVHARIAHHFSQPSTLDIDSLFDAPEMDVDMEARIEAEEEMLEAFLSSRWADYPPLAIEQSMEIVVGGRIVRCTIDAVLDTSRVPGMHPVTIVDWKSGRRPLPHQLESRELQLALYRLAWSRSRRVPLEDIGACFVYLREAESRQVLEAGNLSEEEISRKIAESLMD
ncbi:ATP-dependent DNA helicase [Actinomycetaceae bacterium L2_0104]